MFWKPLDKKDCILQQSVIQSTRKFMACMYGSMNCAERNENNYTYFSTTGGGEWNGKTKKGKEGSKEKEGDKEAQKEPPLITKI